MAVVYRNENNCNKLQKKGRLFHVREVFWSDVFFLGR
jgi:hypothetical protein